MRDVAKVVLEMKNVKCNARRAIWEMPRVVFLGVRSWIGLGSSRVRLCTVVLSSALCCLKYKLRGPRDHYNLRHMNISS